MVFLGWRYRCIQLFLFIIMAPLYFSCATNSYYSQGIPDAQNKSYSGAMFLKKTAHFSYRYREKALLTQLRRGNIPDFLRNLAPVHLEGSVDGVPQKATIFVMKDYLSIGSDHDWVRIPMSPITAQKIADHYGFILPTTKMVDAIYEQAQIKLEPEAFKPTMQMTGNMYFLQHHEHIEKKLKGYDQKSLIAGHKKDVVLSNRLFSKKKRVAIYGWHRGKGDPIQPLSLVHKDVYADYSHGIRLVAKTMLLNGRKIPTVEVLMDPRYSVLLSNEGHLKRGRIAIDHAVYYKKWR